MFLTEQSVLGIFILQMHLQMYNIKYAQDYSHDCKSKKKRVNTSYSVYKSKIQTYLSKMCMRAKSLQSCPTPCDPMDCSPPGSSVHGILQARILQCVAMPSFRGSSQSRDRTYVSCVSCAGRQTLYHRVIAKSCPTLRPHGLQPARVPCPWDFPGKNAGVDCHFLLQGFTTSATYSN